MPSLSPLETVRAFTAAMLKPDFDTALQYVAEDCEYVNGAAGTGTGHGAVRGMLEPFFAPILENEFVVKREAVAGAAVFLERLDRHRLPGGWVELPVTGVYEVHDGLITVWHDYFDLATIQDGMTAKLSG